MKSYKAPKIIKVHFDGPMAAKQPLLPIPDLVLKFSSQEKVYTLWVPAEEMGKVAKMFCDLMDQSKIVFKLEERLR